MMRFERGKPLPKPAPFLRSPIESQQTPFSEGPILRRKIKPKSLLDPLVELVIRHSSDALQGFVRCHNASQLDKARNPHA